MANFLDAFNAGGALEDCPYFEGYFGEHVSQHPGIEQRAGSFQHLCVCVSASPLQPSESLTLGQLLTAMRIVHAPSPEPSWIWKHLQTLSMLMPFKREHLSSPLVLRVSRNGSLLFLTYLPILAPLQRHRLQACRLMRLPQPLGFYPTRVKLPSFPRFDGVPVSPLMNS